jgi:hypothetical protein
MIIVTFMKAIRDICFETAELRRTLAKRYPRALMD